LAAPPFYRYSKIVPAPYDNVTNNTTPKPQIEKVKAAADPVTIQVNDVIAMTIAEQNGTAPRRAALRNFFTSASGVLGGNLAAWEKWKPVNTKTNPAIATDPLSTDCMISVAFAMSIDFQKTN